jgi:hypothetical protein
MGKPAQVAGGVYTGMGLGRLSATLHIPLSQLQVSRVLRHIEALVEPRIDVYRKLKCGEKIDNVCKVHCFGNVTDNFLGCMAFFLS